MEEGEDGEAHSDTVTETADVGCTRQAAARPARFDDALLGLQG